MTYQYPETITAEDFWHDNHTAHQDARWFLEQFLRPIEDAKENMHNDQSN